MNIVDVFSAVLFLQVVRTLTELERFCPQKEVYNHLCLLLTLPKLSDHADYRDWNPSAARVRCFQDIYPLVEKVKRLKYKQTRTCNSALR